MKFEIRKLLNGYNLIIYGFFNTGLYDNQIYTFDEIDQLLTKIKEVVKNG